MNRLLPVSVLLAALVLGSCDKQPRWAQTELYRAELPPATPVHGPYKEIAYPTPNFKRKAVNAVNGVVLHHTGMGSVRESLRRLTNPKSHVSCHVLIDTDGTRYILAHPRKVTFHAGPSRIGKRESCNMFTLGIEFQGNTTETPLTEMQIQSAIEYLLPVMRRYHITPGYITTHKRVREAYQRKHRKRIANKVDITEEEYTRFMKALKARMAEENEKR